MNTIDTCCFYSPRRASWSRAGYTLPFVIMELDEVVNVSQECFLINE